MNCNIPVKFNKKIIITSYKAGYIVALVNDNKLVEIHAIKNSTNNVGDIFCGLVTENKNNINSSFVLINDGNKVYFPEVVKCGTLLPVMIKKKGSFDKKDLATSELSIPGIFSVVFENRVITRTNGKIMGADCVERESVYLKQKLDSLYKYSETRKCGSLLYKAINPIISTVFSVNFDEFDEIITDDELIYKEFQDLYAEYERIGININKKLSFYEDKLVSLYSIYSLKAKIDEAISKKIWLPSGSYLYIEKTEAMTVIDVNSGNTSINKDKEYTFHKINLEALNEVVSQMRLRNLSGIITVDFLKNRENKYKEDLIYNANALLKHDKRNAVCHGYTPLGLVEFSRKRTEPSFYEQIRELENE